MLLTPAVAYGRRYPFLIYWFLDWWWGSFLIGGFGIFSYYIAWELAGVCFVTSCHLLCHHVGWVLSFADGVPSRCLKPV